MLTSPYCYTVGSVGNIFVEEVAVVLHVVCQEVGGGPHHEAVSVDGVIETTGCETKDLLVDVEDVEVVVGPVGHHPARHVAHPLVRVVDEDL